MASYVLVSGNYSRWIESAGKRVIYLRGSVIDDLTEVEIKSLGEKIKITGGSGTDVQIPKPATTPLPTTAVKPPAKPQVEEPVVKAPPSAVANATSTPIGHAELLSKSVPEIEKELKAINDTATLEQIQQEESAGKQRIGVLRVIKARREELS